MERVEATILLFQSKRLIASVLIISKDFLSAGIFPQQWTIPAIFVRFTEENSKKSGKPLSDIRFFRFYRRVSIDRIHAVYFISFRPVGSLSEGGSAVSISSFF